jgi:small-conductance mechanosensitive channel
VTSREDRRERLERLMQRALSELPQRRAPTSLERRVIETIEDRAGYASRQQSSWRESVRRAGFASWPLTARAALIACCLASVIVVLLGLKELATRLAMFAADPSIAGRLQALRDAGEAAVAFGTLPTRLIRLIPPDWLLGGLLATAVLYSVLFALVAIGYSMLYATPERSRS